MGDFQLGVFGATWQEVLLFLCLSVRIGGPMRDLKLGIFGVI